MSEEIRSVDAYGAMRPMTPYYGGGDTATPVPGQGLTPVGEISPDMTQGQQVAMATEPMIETMGTEELAALPSDERLSHIMKMLDDPAYSKQFCGEFQKYMNDMNPNPQLMPPEASQGMQAPSGGGGGLPMIPGGGNQGFWDPSSQEASTDKWDQMSQISNNVSENLTLTGTLEDRIQQLQNALSDLESRKSQLESEIQQLEAEVKELETQLDQLESQKKEIEQQKQQKEQELQQAKQDQQKLQQQKQELKSQESQLNGQKQSLNSQIQSLGAQITSLTSQISSIRASAASMHAQATALMANPYTAAAGAAMEAQAAALDAQATALEAQKVQLQAEKAQAEAQLQQVEAQLQQVQSQMQQVDQQLQTADNKVKQLEEEIADLDKKLQEIEEEIAKLQDQITEKKKQLADKKAELAQVKLQIARVKQLLQEHQAMKQIQDDQKAKDPTNTGEDQPANAGDALGLLSMLGGLGGGNPLGMMGDEDKESDEEKAKKALAELPGGTVDMRAQQANPAQEVSEYGANANAQQVEQMLEQVAQKYGIPPDVMKGVAWNDSRFNPRSQSEDGKTRGAVHVASDLNPDYDVAKGNQNPAYNIEFAGKKLKNNFERTHDWKIATAQFYGKDAPAQAMAGQVMAMASQKPWEQGSQNMTADAGGAAQKMGAKRG